MDPETTNAPNKEEPIIEDCSASPSPTLSESDDETHIHSALRSQDAAPSEILIQFETQNNGSSSFPLLEAPVDPQTLTVEIAIPDSPEIPATSSTDRTVVLSSSFSSSSASSSSVSCSPISQDSWDSSKFLPPEETDSKEKPFHQ